MPPTLIHYPSPWAQLRAACGVGTTITADLDAVTCQTCVRSLTYRAAARSRLATVQATADEAALTLTAALALLPLAQATAAPTRGPATWARIRSARETYWATA